MTWLKRYPFSVVVLIAGILFSLVHFFDDSYSGATSDQVKMNNRIRRMNNVPVIEDDWVKESLTRSGEKWSDGIRGINTIRPVHLYKEIFFSSGKIDREKDAFHFEASDTLQYRLILNHKYKPVDSCFTRVDSKLIVYKPREFPPSYSRSLTKEAVDSVLLAWGLEIN